MTFFQWRRFNFFDLFKVTDGGTLSQSLKEVTITCTTSGRGHVILGDTLGFIHLLDRQYQRESFKAYNVSTTHVLQLKQSPFLGTVGEDDPGVNPVIKIWNLDKRDAHGFPTCVHTVRAIPGNRPVPLTAFTIDEQMHLMAAGFADGSVVLYRGDLSRDRHSKQKFLQPGTSGISGLALRTSQKVTHLHVASTSAVFTYTILSKDKEQHAQLDSVGCSPGCFAFADSKQGQNFMIARNDAIYCYTNEGRGPCYAFEGEKQAVLWFRGYLVIISKVSGKGDAANDKATVTIFDVQNKFIAFTSPIPNALQIISEWGSLLILTKEKAIHQLVEKDLHSKLDILFKKNLYDVAIRVAKNQQYDIEGLIEIFKLYGDHLYAKGNHSGAMEQYLKTIGRLEPSYVIKKFLDAQRIHQLTAYLQELHKQGLATEDHTTLLLNCYTKLRDTEHLNQFLITKDPNSDFDVDTAIRVCRQAGYFEQALQLAENREKHSSYLKILLEDTCDYQKALEYTRKLPPSMAKDVLKEYGGVLLQELPEEATKLLLELFCNIEQVTEGSELQEFLLLFINHTDKLVDFLERVIETHPDSQSLLHFALLEQYLTTWSKKISDTALEKKILKLLQHPSVLGCADRALFLCQSHKFRPGVLFIFEKTKLYAEILNFYANENDFENVLATCKKFGQQESSLWVKAMTAASSSDRVSDECLSEILAAIEKLKLLPPLRVVDLLCRSPTATLGLARDYLIRALETDQANIAEDQRLIDQYRKETKEVRQKIHEIKTSALVFQGSKCNVCNQPLELPSVHFLCLHSFHQHCFDSYSENDNECPACHTENKRILDIVKAQEQSKELHEAFHGQLEKADEPFTVLADYFGRGVFNTVLSFETAISGQSKALPGLLPTNTWGPQNAGPGYEAKLRQIEGKNPTLQHGLVSEAKLRLNEGKGISQQGASEAKLRQCEGKNTSLQQGIANEGRLRAQEIGPQIAAKVSEGRLRNTEAHFEKTSGTLAAASEGRFRLLEGNKSSMGQTVTVPIVSKGAARAVAASSAPTDAHKGLPTAGNAAVRRSMTNLAGANAGNNKNPFEDEDDYDESKNPFAEAEGSENPFGVEDVYNESLNPFAE